MKKELISKLHSDFEHIVQIDDKIVAVGSGAQREITDVALTRCLLLDCSKWRPLQGPSSV